MNKSEIRQGAKQAGISYLLWGLLPIYWKFLGGVNASEILANRIFWSFIFMLAVLFITKKWGLFTQTIKGFVKNQKQLYALALASVLISINWFTYIWAVNSGLMIDTSLGYYINPLVSILLGVVVLKERLTVYQYISCGFAAVGVLIITISYGQFPWVAIVLALSFALYGLAKKLINVDSSVGLTLETLVITPIAVVYMLILAFKGSSLFFSSNSEVNWLLIGSGAATAIPLLFFAKGAQKIPLSLLGFLQYISPTITLLLGIFVYNERFSIVRLLSFMFIWAALVIYSLSKAKILSEKRMISN